MHLPVFSKTKEGRNKWNLYFRDPTEILYCSYWFKKAMDSESVVKVKCEMLSKTI